MSGQENTWILFFIKRTKLLKNGEAPIFVRITVNKERAEFGLKKSVLPKLWDESNQRVKGKAQSALNINSSIEGILKKVEAINAYMSMEGEVVTARLLKEKLVGKKEDRRTILKIFQTHNDNARKLIGIDFAKDTVTRYETSYKHTYDFIRWQYKREDLALEELNKHFVDNYEIYLKTVRNCSHNTATKYLKNFKKIVIIALDNGWLAKDPFGNKKLKLLPVNPTHLTKEELIKIQRKEITIDRLAEVRDVFLFCCYTGLAFSDVKTLRKLHLSLDGEGITWIHKKRTKTGQMSTIFLIDAAKAILKKYANHPDVVTKDILLPVKSNQKMNTYLKELADICGVDKPITTHVARHTFATTVTLENNMPLEVVSKSLGHSNTKMTQHYAKTTEVLIKNNMQKIAQIF